MGARPTHSSVSMWQLSLHVVVMPRAVACYHEACATNDMRRKPAPGAIIQGAIGASGGRSGGFFAFLARGCLQSGTQF